jgi:hypothetical protein
MITTFTTKQLFKKKEKKNIDRVGGFLLWALKMVLRDLAGINVFFFSFFFSLQFYDVMKMAIIHKKI